MVELPIARMLSAWVGNYICNEGKWVHLYGGAAAMLDDVLQVQWEVYCARVTCGLCLAAGLCPFLSLFQSL